MNQDKHMIKKIAIFLTAFVFMWILTDVPVYAKKEDRKQSSLSEEEKTDWNNGELPSGLARQKERKERRKDRHYDRKQKKEKHSKKDKDKEKDSASE